MKISYEDYRDNPNNSLHFEINVEELKPMKHNAEEKFVQKKTLVHLERWSVNRSYTLVVKSEKWAGEVHLPEEALEMLSRAIESAKALSLMEKGVRDAQ